jgi:Ca2+-transporting ATPase
MPDGDVRALVFVALATANLALVLIHRTGGGTPLQAMLRRNPSLWVVTAATATLLAAAVAWPPTRALLRFGPLHADDVALVAAAGASLLLFGEVVQRWRVTRA